MVESTWGLSRVDSRTADRIEEMHFAGVGDYGAWYLTHYTRKSDADTFIADHATHQGLASEHLATCGVCDGPESLTPFIGGGERIRPEAEGNRPGSPAG
jgi:hypothetical protein